MNILTPLQKEVLKAIGASPLGKMYVWTGGTALAYRLKHRYSADLDFFSQDMTSAEIFLGQIQHLQHTLKLKQKQYEERLNRRLFIMSRGKEEDLRLEFVYFPFPPLKKPVRDKEFGIKIDSLDDIAVNKVLSAFERKEPKDVYDLYVLAVRRGYDLKKLIKGVQKKFGVTIDYTSLMAKILATAKKLHTLTPWLVKAEKSLKDKMLYFFQDKTNHYLFSLLF